MLSVLLSHLTSIRTLVFCSNHSQRVVSVDTNLPAGQGFHVMARRLGGWSVGRLAANVGARYNGFESVLADMGVQSAGASRLMPAAGQTTRYTSQAVFAVAVRQPEGYECSQIALNIACCQFCLLPTTTSGNV